MIDQTLVQSGFDAEVLLSERYIRYLLLSSVESGSFPLNIVTTVDVEDPDSGETTELTLLIDFWPSKVCCSTLSRTATTYPRRTYFPRSKS